MLRCHFDEVFIKISLFVIYKYNFGRQVTEKPWAWKLQSQLDCGLHGSLWSWRIILSLWTQFLRKSRVLAPLGPGSTSQLPQFHYHNSAGHSTRWSLSSLFLAGKAGVTFEALFFVVVCLFFCLLKGYLSFTCSKI